MRERRQRRVGGDAGERFYEADFLPRLAGSGLTPRQQQVVDLVLRGLSNREIAAKLFIEEYTVKVHLRDIFHRLKVHRRTALMARIFQLPHVS